MFNTLSQLSSQVCESFDAAAKAVWTVAHEPGVMRSVDAAPFGLRPSRWFVDTLV